MTSLIIAAIIIVLVLWVIIVYNKFVTSKTHIDASIQEIGNQLKRQAEMIPNLTSATKGFLKKQSAIFKDLTEARKGVTDAVKGAVKNPQKLLEASEKMLGALGQIRVLVESTPEIKGEQTVQKLMEELRDTSDKIMYARRTLIDLTADYNIMVIKIPSNLVASIFGFKKQPGLKMPEQGSHVEVSAAETKAPTVNLD